MKKILKPPLSSRLLNHRGEALLLVFMSAIVFIIYSNTLRSPFIFDDVGNILMNDSIRMLHLDLNSIFKAASSGTMVSRPVANVSLALNYYIGNKNVVGYHLINIFIHILSGILLYFFVKATLALMEWDRQQKQQTSVLISFFTALIWLVHPLQTQSVTYIIQRMNSLATMFYVASLLLYITGRRIHWLGRTQGSHCFSVEKRSGLTPYIYYTGSIATGILAFGSKEIAATLPFFILFYEWYFFRDLDLKWLKQNFVYLLLTIAGIGVLIFLFTGPHPLKRILADYAMRDFTLGQRLLTELRVVIFYIGLLLFPHPSRLNLDHDFPLSNSLLDPITTIFSLIAILGMIVVAFSTAKRNKLLSFCIFWFLGNLVIESSVIGLEIIFEHRIYLPSMLIILLFIVLLFRHVKMRWVSILILSMSVGICSYWTYKRNAIWKDEVTLWSDCVKKSPDKFRPRNNLGKALTDAGRTSEAITQFDYAIKLKPGMAELHNNLGFALAKNGSPNEAIRYFIEALKLKPGYPEAHLNWGYALSLQDKHKEAIEHFAESIRLDPNYTQAHYNWAAVLLREGDKHEAFKHFVEASRIEPDFPGVNLAIGNLLADKGSYAAARKFYLNETKISPANAELFYSIGNAFFYEKKLDEAAKYYHQALQQNPNYSEAYNNLGALFMLKGEMGKAISLFRNALTANPNNADAHNNMGRAFEKEGNIRSAIEEYTEALRLNPDLQSARNNLQSILK